MSPRFKYHCLLFVGLPIGFALFAFLSFVISPWFAFGGLVWTVFVGEFSSEIKCPVCKRPVGWHRYRMLGRQFAYWAPLVGPHCDGCQNPYYGGRREIEE